MNRASSIVLTLEMEKLRSSDDSDLPKAEPGSPHIVSAFPHILCSSFSFAGLLPEEQ